MSYSHSGTTIMLVLSTYLVFGITYFFKFGRNTKAITKSNNKIRRTVTMNPSMPPTRLTEVMAFDSVWFEILESTGLEVLERLPVYRSELSVVVNSSGVLIVIQVLPATCC